MAEFTRESHQARALITAAAMGSSSPTLQRQRYKLVLAYDGTAFHGWQKQATLPNQAELRTVGGVVQDTLCRVLRQPILLVGASRTDAGVHARGQVAHFDAATPIPLARLRSAINSRLPADVEALSVEPVHDSFDAIRDAKNKRYRYRIFNTDRRPLEIRHCVWHCWHPLGLETMRRAAARLVGTHDFAGFAAAGHGRVTTVRSVFRCEVTRHEPEVHIEVEGSGFLYNMVRIIAGTLVDVGRGRLAEGVIDAVLTSKDRRQAGPTLPPQGLCLMWVQH